MRSQYFDRFFYRNVWKKISFIIIINLLVCISWTIFENLDYTVSASRATDTNDNDDFTTATLLNDDSVEGEVTDIDSVDFYKATLLIGQTLSIEFEPDIDGLKNLNLTIFDSEHLEIKSFIGILPGKKVYFNYTVNQTPLSPYYLRVRPQDTGNKYNLSTSIKSQNDGDSGSDAPDVLAQAQLFAGGAVNGFLAGIDIEDFYKFSIGPGRIIDFNFTVQSNSDPVKFIIYNNTLYNKIKVISSVEAGQNIKFQYTTNANGSRTFYIGASIAEQNTESKYEIDVIWKQQDDGGSYLDAGDNLSAATTISGAGDYSGWLGNGDWGLDQYDIFQFEAPPGNKTIYINVTQSVNLDTIVHVYNESYGVLKSLNPVKGDSVNINFTINSPHGTTVYLQLKIADGKSSRGDYSFEVSIVNYSDSGGVPDIDKDNDDLPDDWEILHFESISKYGADDDPDLDGYTNQEELNANSEPFNKSSTPPDDPKFEHLTTDVCKRTYDDVEKDVFHWSGTFNMETDVTKIGISELIEMPSYDLSDLESLRVGRELVIQLKTLSNTEDSSVSIPDEDNPNIELVKFFAVFLVNNTYKEIKMVGTKTPEFTESSNPLILYNFTYTNKQFNGPKGTKGKLLDNGKTYEWQVPLETVHKLDKNFGIYALAYYHKEYIAENPHTFSIYADTMGTGAQTPNPSIITRVMNKLAYVDDYEVNVTITTDNAGGDIAIKKATKPGINPPSNLGDLGIYIDVSLTGGIQEKSVFVKIKYLQSDIPLGFEEKNIKIYYFNETTNAWVKIPNSGVWENNNTAWAQLTHLSIFSPLVEPSEKSSSNGGDEIDWFMIILIVIIIVAILVVVIIFLVLRSRRKPVPPPQLPSRPKRALSPEFFDCPRCRASIEVPYSKDNKVTIHCPECNAKGKIDNPYLDRVDDDRERDYDDDIDRYDRGKERERQHEKEYDDDYDRDRRRDDSEYDEYYDDYDDDNERDRDYYDHRPQRRDYGPRGGPDVGDIEYKPPSHVARERESKSGIDRDKHAPIDYEDEEEDYEYKTCPKCKNRIQVPYVEDEKVTVKCRQCGAKGKVKNPYLN